MSGEQFNPDSSKSVRRSQFLHTIGAFLFDTNSNREEQRQQVIQARSAPRLEFRNVRLVIDRASPLEKPTPKQTPSQQSAADFRQFIQEIDDCFIHQYSSMLEDLEKPAEARARGGAKMKELFDAAVSHAVDETTIVLEGLSSALELHEDDESAKELIDTGQAYGIDPDVMRKIIFKEDGVDEVND